MWETPGDRERQGKLVCCSLWVTVSWTLLRDGITATTRNKSVAPLIASCVRRPPAGLWVNW